MELIGWVEPDQVDDLWPDAVMMEPDVRDRLLLAAHESCEAYAPALPSSGDIPERYVMAQIFQAKALWAMQRQGGGEQFGPDGMSVAVYPLDARIRSLLRPKRPFGGLR
jgi:hypothetical protein